MTEPPDYRLRVVESGYRSVMSVLVRGRHQRCALHFWSRRTGAFTERDVPLARHIALHVALGLSHEQLAEVAQQARAERARAQRLERRVQALAEALDSRRGFGRMAGIVGDVDAGGEGRDAGGGDRGHGAADRRVRDR